MALVSQVRCCVRVILVGLVDVCLNYPFDSAQGTFLRWLSGVEASLLKEVRGISESCLFNLKQNLRQLSRYFGINAMFLRQRIA